MVTVTPREGDAVAIHAPSPPDAPPARPFSHGQRTEYVAQDDTAPQWVRAPEQRVYRVPRCCGRDPASGRGPGGHGGRAAARATLPPRARQKGLVLASASASTGGGFSPNPPHVMLGMRGVISSTGSSQVKLENEYGATMA